MASRTKLPRRLPLFVRKASLPMPGEDYELDLPKGHLSHSQISTYLKCPSLYYHIYVLGMGTPNSVYFFEGNCMDHVLEQTGRRWSKKKKHLSHADAVKEHETYFEKNESKVENWFDVKPDDVRGRAETYLKILFTGSSKFLDVIQPRIIGRTPATQLKWAREFAGIPVVGVTDLLTENGVWDYKVVGKKPDVEQSLQLSFYSVAHEVENVGFTALFS